MAALTQVYTLEKLVYCGIIINAEDPGHLGKLDEVGPLHGTRSLEAPDIYDHLWGGARVGGDPLGGS